MCAGGVSKKKKISGRLLSNEPHIKTNQKRKFCMSVTASWESGAAREEAGPMVGSDDFEASTFLITSSVLFSVPLVAFFASLQQTK